MRNKTGILLNSKGENTLTVGGDIAWVIKEISGSTGYEWRFTHDNSGVYKAVEKLVLHPSVGVPGVPGAEVWTFKALKPGHGELRFRLFPPGADRPVEQEIFHVQVVTTMVSVLMVVDVEGALSSGDLQDNIYLVDTNKYVGSGDEGQAELKTVLSAGGMIRWSVVPVQPDGEVTIDSFSGQAVDEKIIDPQQDPTTGVWSSKFHTSARSGTEYQYSATLSFEGQKLSFDPFLIVK